MSHVTKDKKKLLARVKRIQGQASAVERALESDQECTLVLQQIAAMRGATNGLMSQVLQGHIREHLGAVDISSEQREKEVADLIDILKSYLK